MNYFDFHCHLDTSELDSFREDIVHNMKQQNIGACTIGVNLERSRVAVSMAKTLENVWCCVGQHPVDTYAEEFKAVEYQKLIDQNQDHIVGVGECGLDYYWPTKDFDSGKKNAEELHAEKQRQRLLFRKHITLAVVNNLPLMLHVRSSTGTQDAHEEVLEILSQYPECRSQATTSQVKVVFHFYTEGAHLAQRIVEAGYYVSFPGVITFGKKVTDLEDAVRAVPIGRMFAETDTPYAAPAPHRGQTNNPLFVKHVYEKIAELKGEDPEVVRTQILHNVQDFYGINF